MGRVAADVGALPDVTEKTMHDAYELSKFFSEADLADKTEVLLEVCNREPDLLLDIIRNITNEPWMKECKAFMGDGTDIASKIIAIKHCRAATGMGLKEAKEAVEAL